MRRRFALCLLGLGVLATGCNLVGRGAHNVYYDSHLCLEKVNQRRYACAAWDAVKQACTGTSYSEDYAQGFKDGFLDYLKYGDCGPPALPPACYRVKRYQSPQARQAVADWYEGFRHGVLEAGKSGWRDVNVLPVVVTEPPQYPPPFYPPGLRGHPVPVLTPPPQGEGPIGKLPPPRELPDEDPPPEGGMPPKELPDADSLPKAGAPPKELPDADSLPMAGAPPKKLPDEASLPKAGSSPKDE